MSTMTMDDWERVTADPDPIADLGYAAGEWTVSETDRFGHRHRVFVSSQDEDHDREAFIIADETAVIDPVANR